MVVKTKKTPKNQKLKAFKVYVKNVPRFTIYATSKDEARQICENRKRGVHFDPIYYSKVVELS